RGAAHVESSSQGRRWHTLRAASAHDFPQQEYLSLIFKHPTNRGFTKVHDGTSAGPNADQRFVSYYAEQSASAQTKQRFEGVRRAALDLRATLGLPVENLDIADVGCGAGTQTLMWAAAGHRAHGVDISAPLIDLARERAEKASASAQFHVGSATKLPFDD